MAQLNIEKIQFALSGALSPDALTWNEQEMYLEQLMEQASAPTPEQKAFFAARGDAAIHPLTPVPAPENRRSS